MEKGQTEGKCPRCGDIRLNMYFGEHTGERLGVLCPTCNFKAYFLADNLVAINN